jgi:hypothetical protein
MTAPPPRVPSCTPLHPSVACRYHYTVIDCLKDLQLSSLYCPMFVPYSAHSLPPPSPPPLAHLERCLQQHLSAGPSQCARPQTTPNATTNTTLLLFSLAIHVHTPQKCPLSPAHLERCFQKHLSTCQAAVEGGAHLMTHQAHKPGGGGRAGGGGEANVGG